MSIPEVINGRYEVAGTIGVGGMGVLYRARDPWIGGRVVALKLLKQGLDDAEIRARFKQEASAAGVLEHENIVRIFDVGEHQGQPFIAMEYVDGDTLAAIIRERVPVSLLKKLEWVEQLCDALAYAHAHGIVHRDIKPLNLIIERRRQRLKVLDFGIAKLADSGITAAGMMIGTTNYMSPEQMRGDATIDHRSDIFSVGATVFELLTGTRAFPGSIADGLMGRIMSLPAPSLLEKVPDLPPDLEAIVGRALEKDAGARYGDLAQMRDEVRALRHRLHETEDRTTVLPPPGSTDRGVAAATPRPTAVSSIGPATVVPPPLPPVSVPATSTSAAATTPVASAAGGTQPAATSVPGTVATAAHAPAPGRPGQSSSVLLFVAVAAVVMLGLVVAGWWLVPWGALLQRSQNAGGAEVAVPATETAPAAPVDEAAEQRARAAEAARLRLVGVPITVDAQPWAEVRLVPALTDGEVSSLPPDVVRELAKERGPYVTPFVADVPPGDYLMSFDNDALGLSHSQRVTVTASGTNRFVVVLPGFDADRFIAQLLRSGTR